MVMIQAARKFDLRVSLMQFGWGLILLGTHFLINHYSWRHLMGRASQLAHLKANASSTRVEDNLLTSKRLGI